MGVLTSPQVSISSEMRSGQKCSKGILELSIKDQGNGQFETVRLRPPL